MVYGQGADRPVGLASAGRGRLCCRRPLDRVRDPQHYGRGLDGAGQWPKRVPWTTERLGMSSSAVAVWLAVAGPALGQRPSLERFPRARSRAQPDLGNGSGTRFNAPYLVPQLKAGPGGPPGDNCSGMPEGLATTALCLRSRQRRPEPVPSDERGPKSLSVPAPVHGEATGSREAAVKGRGATSLRSEPLRR